MGLVIDRKRSIGQAAQEVGVQEHVLRFWETQFRDYIKPVIGNGGRRYFYDNDVKVLKMIKHYLHEKGYTIRGLQSLMKNETLQLDDVAPIKNSTMENGSSVHSYRQSPPKITDPADEEIYAHLGVSLRNELRNFKSELNHFYEKLKNI
ncbi:MAG: MerR family transcriptional regulator [Rickettsiales bacterium]|jgi:DNA-binding transcriptional MerR regulator|nr:MerR family transcriptional regulator [Rickettsiales bacterium]